MKVEVVAKATGFPLSSGEVQRFLARALRASRHGAREVSVFLCGDGRMRRLNREYRGKDKATDVLSFPGEETHLGDILISVPTARRQAEAAGHPVERELKTLLLHGVLHCLGYDHETDQGEMERVERRLRRRWLREDESEGLHV